MCVLLEFVGGKQGALTLSQLQLPAPLSGQREQ